MMRLNDSLITSFLYENTEYQINMAFDVVLDAFDVLGDDFLRDHEKADICLDLLLNKAPTDINKKLELWNYVFESFVQKEQKQTIEYDLQGNPMPVKNDKKDKFIDLDKDAGYIFASFLNAYGINLHEQQGKLHWHQFQSLLNGLPEGTIMQKIIRIRTWEPSKDDSNEHKKNMYELQKAYALEDESDKGVE